MPASPAKSGPRGAAIGDGMVGHRTDGVHRAERDGIEIIGRLGRSLTMTSSDWLGLGARRPMAVANVDVGRPVAADVDVDDGWQRLGSGGLRVTRCRCKRSVDQTLFNIPPPIGPSSAFRQAAP
jgi:hypothetical protein